MLTITILILFGARFNMWFTWRVWFFTPAEVRPLSLPSFPAGCGSSSALALSCFLWTVSAKSFPLFRLEFLKRRSSSGVNVRKMSREGAMVWKLIFGFRSKLPRMIFSSLGSSVRTGGMRRWSISWSSQMMLSSQRPYTNSSLSMGKMENQGQSSSCEAAVTETQINKKRTFKNIYNDKLYIFDVKRKIKTTKKTHSDYRGCFCPVWKQRVWRPWAWGEAWEAPTGNYSWPDLQHRSILF